MLKISTLKGLTDQEVDMVGIKTIIEEGKTKQLRKGRSLFMLKTNRESEAGPT